jgi:hypothetical protein
VSTALRTPGTSRLRSVGPTRPEPVPVVESRSAPQTLFDRYAESAFGIPPWMLQARLSDFSRGGTGVALGVATGTPSDRKGGRDVPRFWSEIDLRGYRVLARHICESNPFGIGFLGALTDYHVRKGYGWQACRKGPKKTAYPTAGAPADPLVEKAQRILDEFRDQTKWPLKSREAFRRWCRDGEVVGRWFHGGRAGCPSSASASPTRWARPTGNTDGDESFGIANAPATSRAITDYHFFDDDGVRGEWVAADRVTFAKRNTDSGVKRGMPDFFPVAQELEDCTKLVRTMLATSIRQAGTAWIEKFPGRTPTRSRDPSRVRARDRLLRPGPGAVDLPACPWWLMPQVGGGLNPWEPPGVVRKVEGDREYQAGPDLDRRPRLHPGRAGRAPRVRGDLVVPRVLQRRRVEQQHGVAIVAGSRSRSRSSRNQFEFGAVWERECALKVFDLAVLAGMLTRDERAALDVETTEPAVWSADPGKDTRSSARNSATRSICLDTVRQKIGVDPQHEAEGVKKDPPAAAIRPTTRSASRSPRASTHSSPKRARRASSRSTSPSTAGRRRSPRRAGCGPSRRPPHRHPRPRPRPRRTNDGRGKPRPPSTTCPASSSARRPSRSRPRASTRTSPAGAVSSTR